MERIVLQQLGRLSRLRGLFGLSDGRIGSGHECEKQGDGKNRVSVIAHGGYDDLSQKF